ncbi:hypothetical protein ACFQ1M_06320 [Sungkyunkwania multivorans]|uniref:Uncharacterized protein n=1 Tax=Sungkyunkwania multivorans TaxID=1173618 RepID=A0ABW3CVN7_9FLAO
MKTTIFIVLSLLSFSAYAQSPDFRFSKMTSSIRDTTTIKLEDKDEKVYKTLEIIEYNYLHTEKKAKDSIYKKLIKELYDNSLQTDPSNFYNASVIKRKEDSIRNLKKEIATDVEKLDSLYFEYTQEYLTYKKFNALSFGPVRSAAFFDLIYNHDGKRFKVLNNTGLNIGDNTGSIYSELVSGNLGVFRVSLGTMIANSTSDSLQDSKESEAFQRLVTYGGNTVLTFEYPLLYAHSSNQQYNLISRLVAKGTADFPEFGTTTEDWAGSASVGIDLYGDASLSNNALRFFFNFNMSQVYGTGVFRDNLGVDKTHFTFGQLTLGLVVAQNLKLSFVLETFSSEVNLRNRNVVAGGQVLH